MENNATVPLELAPRQPCLLPPAGTTQGQSRPRPPMRPEVAALHRSQRSALKESHKPREGDDTYFRELPFVTKITDFMSRSVDPKLGNYAKTNPHYGQLAKLHFRVASSPEYFASRQHGRPVEYPNDENALREYMRKHITTSYKFFSAPDDKGIIILSDDLDSDFYTQGDLLAKLVAKKAAALAASNAGVPQEDILAIENAGVINTPVLLEDDDDDGESGDDDDAIGKANAAKKVAVTAKKVARALQKTRDREQVREMFGRPKAEGVSILGIKARLIKNERHGEGKLSFLNSAMEGLLFGLSKDSTTYKLVPREFPCKAKKAHSFYSAYDTVMAKSKNDEHKNDWRTFAQSGLVPNRPQTGAGYKPGDAAEFAASVSTRRAFPSKYSNSLEYIVDRLNSGTIKRSSDSTYNKESTSLLEKQAHLFTTVAENSAVALLDDLEYTGNYDSAANKAMNQLALFDEYGGLGRLSALLGKQVGGKGLKGAPKAGKRRGRPPGVPKKRGGKSDDDSSSSAYDSDEDNGEVTEDVLSAKPRYEQLLLLPTWAVKTGVMSLKDELVGVLGNNVGADLISFILSRKKDRRTLMSGKNDAANLIFRLKQFAVITTKGAGNIVRHEYDHNGDVVVYVTVDGHESPFSLLDIVSEDVGKSTIFLPADYHALMQPYEKLFADDTLKRSTAAIANIHVMVGEVQAAAAGFDYKFNDAVQFTAARSNLIIMGRIVSFVDVSGKFVVRQMIRDGRKLPYFNDTNVAPPNIAVIPRKEALLLLMDGNLPRIAPPNSLTQKQKAVLNVLCTVCQEHNTPEQAEFCDCYIINPAYTYVCQDSVCTDILHEHQRTCNVFHEGDAEVVEKVVEEDGNMDVDGDEAPVGPPQAPPPHPSLHQSPPPPPPPSPPPQLLCGVPHQVHDDSKAYDSKIHVMYPLVKNFVDKGISIKPGFIVTPWAVNLGAPPLGVVKQAYQTNGKGQPWRCEVDWRSGREAKDCIAKNLCYVEKIGSGSYNALVNEQE